MLSIVFFVCLIHCYFLIQNIPTTSTYEVDSLLFWISDLTNRSWHFSNKTDRRSKKCIRWNVKCKWRYIVWFLMFHSNQQQFSVTNETNKTIAKKHWLQVEFNGCCLTRCACLSHRELLTLTEGLICHGNLSWQEVELEARENVIYGGDGNETVGNTSL